MVGKGNMMYKNSMVCCLKNNGKILREKDDNVFLPFGSEYSIYFKNLEARKAKVTIEIDGEDVLDGNSLLIEPKSTLELEGFMKGSKAEHAFRFIKKSDEISEYRGDHIDDGLIVVNFQYEKFKPIMQPITYTYTNYYPYWINTTPPFHNDVLSTFCCSTADSTLRSKSVTLDDFNIEDGITVHGTAVSQNFRYGYIGELEENKYTMVLKLRGYTAENETVEKPLLVSDKLQCKTCGRTSKSDAKFCANCGTALL